VKVLNAKGKRCLIISDTHCPYNHKDWLKFLHSISLKYLEKNSIIIHIGDEVDNHAISMHPNDNDLYSAGDELKKAIICLQELEKLFPTLYLLDSNHGSLAFRNFKLRGIPIKYLRPLNEVYGVSKKWSWHDEIILQTKLGDTYICHGKSAKSGMLAKDVGMSTIEGHYHGAFEICWFQSAIRSFYAMKVGCLISWTDLAFAYGKNHMKKPVLGVGIISKEGYPRLLKMELDNNLRWTGKLP